MSIKISFKTPVAEKNIKNYVLFANENFEINTDQKPTGFWSHKLNKIIHNSKHFPSAAINIFKLSH